MAPREVVTRKRSLAGQRQHLRVLRTSDPAPPLPLPDDRGPFTRSERMLGVIAASLVLLAIGCGVLAARGGW